MGEKGRSHKKKGLIAEIEEEKGKKKWACRRNLILKAEGKGTQENLRR